MFNQSILVGRLARDPELRRTQTNKSVTNITIACDSGYGEHKSTDFVNCVAWNKQAEFIADYLHKGSLVFIQGKIQNRSYDNNQGHKVYVQEVLIGIVKSLDSKASKETASNTRSAAGYYPDEPPIDDYGSSAGGIDISSDDLPF